MELRLPLEMSPGREAACRAVFGTWGFFPNDARKNCPFVLTSFTGVDDLLKNSGDLESLDQSSKHVTVTHLLSGLEQILRTLAKAMPKGSFTYRSLDNTGETTSSPAQPPRTPSHTRSPRSLPPLFSELSLVVQEQGKGNVTVGQSHARMLLDWAVAAAAEESGNGRRPERALQGKGGRS